MEAAGTLSKQNDMTGIVGEREHFFGSAKTVAVFTLISRILGLVRDMVMVPIGGGKLADRFWTAYSVPNLFRRLFGEGALSAAFVPVFTSVSEQEGVEKARRVLANVAGILSIVLSAIVILVELGLLIAWKLGPADDLDTFYLQMVGLLMPFMITICLLALGSAALNCRGHFTYPAFAPIILNLFLIAAAVWLAPAISEARKSQFFIIGISLLVAGVVQLAGVIWLLLRVGLVSYPRLRPLIPETRKIMGLMLPMLVPLGALQLTAFLDRYLAMKFTEIGSRPLEPGIVRCLYPAARLYMLPMGLMAIPIATVVFPLLGRYASRGDSGGLRETTSRALRLCIFLSVPTAVVLAMVADRLVALLFERGQFDSRDTIRTAWILRMYCIGLWAYFFNQVCHRAFFAVRRPRGPMMVALVLAPINIALVIFGIHTPLKGGAIGLATAVTQSVNALVLIYLLHRMWGTVGLRGLVISLFRTLVATAIAVVSGIATLHYAASFIAGLVPGSWPGWCEQASVLIAAIVVTGSVYILASLVQRSPELNELLGRGDRLA